MVGIAVFFFVMAAVLLVVTLIGPQRFAEREMRQYRDPGAAAKVLMLSDDQLRYRRIGTGVAAVITALGGFYALNLADDYANRAAGASADEVRAAAERVAGEIDGAERLSTDSGYSRVDIELKLMPASSRELHVEDADTGAGFTITNAENEHPVCLSIDRHVDDSPPTIGDDLPPQLDPSSLAETVEGQDWVELSASVRAGAC